MKILIVDDEEMMRQVVKEFILSEGVYAEQDILLAGNGVEGLAQFQEHCPHIVISDVLMPKMGGAEMVTRIRGLSADCEFIMMTAFADIDLALAVIKVGVFELLRKPFEPTEINLSLQKIAEKIALRQEIKECREKLVSAEKFSSLGLLSAGIAHEINNPNTFVKGNLELLKKYAALLTPSVEKLASMPGENQCKFQLIRDTLQDTIDSALRGTDRISKIVNGLSIFSRKSTGSATSVLASDLWREALVLTSHRHKRHEVVINLPETLKPIQVDIQDMVQVFMNLLVNAVDAIEMKSEMGQVTVSGSDDLTRNEQVLTVRDTGIGMDPEIVDRIFLPFFSTKNQKGTGLGLSISKGAVEAHHGTISVRSKKGEFTEFEVRLPLAA